MDLFCKKVSIQLVGAGVGPSTQNNLDTGAGPSTKHNLGYDNPGYDNYVTDYGYDHNQDVTSPPREPVR